MSLEFWLIGASICLAVFFAERRRWPRARRAVLAGLAILIGLVVVWYSAVSQGKFLGPERWYSSSPYREIIFFLLMMLGMAARYLTGVIEERRERIRSLVHEGRDVSNIKPRFDAWEFVYPMLFSVVTYGGLITQIGDGLTTANVVLCFQTGFFWQTVLKRESPHQVEASAR